MSGPIRSDHAVAPVPPLLPGLEGHRPHPLHGLERNWPETNCYVDLWIEVLHADGREPTAALAFTPVAGVLVERAAAHARGHSLYVHVPMWGGADSPGRLVHFAEGQLAEEVAGDRCGDGTELFELGGFYRETAAFLDAVTERREPSPGLRESRQSVAIALSIRERRAEYRA